MAAVLQRFAKPDAHTFHEVMIGGRCFRGVASSRFGLRLYEIPNKAAGERALRGCAIGRAIMAQTPIGWAVCKYDARQVKIPLQDFSEAQAVQLANEFGLPGELHSIREPAYRFYRSPAFAGLVEWVRARPRVAKGDSVDAGEFYGIEEWYATAIARLAAAA